MTNRRKQSGAVLILAATAFLVSRSAMHVQGQQFAVQPSEATSPASSIVDPNNRVLVLRNGGVLRGRIKSVSTGWLVSTSKGHAIIPFHQVHFDADDLNEAYLRIRLQSGKPTAGSHLRLADWCLSQKLFPEATRELRDALKKDPSNETARLMLARVENEIKRQTPESQAQKAARAIVHVGAETKPADEQEVRSLSGLSSSTAQEFVASIQPLLLNKCGNARCHGSASQHEFRLARTKVGASNSRVISEKNLAAVLGFIGPDKSGHSRLLKVVRGSHAGRTILNGRYGSEQQARLKTWVSRAATELSADLESTQLTAFAAKPATPRIPDETTSQPVSSARYNPPVEINTSAARSSSQDAEAATKQPTEELTNFQRVLQEARQTVKKQDAFDPEDFNRRFAGSRSQ